MKNKLHKYFELLSDRYIKKGWIFVKRIAELATRNEMRILPGNLAFFIVLSIAPIITLIGLICTNFSSPLEEILKFANDTLPKGVFELLSPILNNSGNNENIILYLILAFIAASNGAHSVIISSNTLYNVKTNNVIFRRIKALFSTIILLILFVFILLILAFGNVIYETLVNLEIITSNIPFYTFVSFIKWPIAFFIVFVSLKLLYTISVDKRIPSHFMNTGAIFTTLGWTFVTAFYSYYTDNLANYDIFYGGLTNLIIMMIWIYILSYILVIGISINASIYEENNK